MTLDNRTRPGEASGQSAASRIDVHMSTDQDAACPSEQELAELVARVLQSENVAFDRIGLVLADHDVVTDLNQRYLGHDWHTDVLSFLLDEEAPIDGEVYVDVQTAAERCDEFGASPTEEILRYVVHGVLHLAGYDDSSDEERAEMQELEDRYLTQIRGTGDIVGTVDLPGTGDSNGA